MEQKQQENQLNTGISEEEVHFYKEYDSSYFTTDDINPTCFYAMSCRLGEYGMSLPTRIFGRDVGEVVVIPKEYYGTIKDSKHTTNISKCPEYVDVRKEARALGQEIMSAPCKNGYSPYAINHIVRLAQTGKWMQ